MLEIINPLPACIDTDRYEWQAIGRVDGSIGLTLDNPAIKIKARKSDIIEITGKSEHIERMRNSAKGSAS